MLFTLLSVNIRWILRDRILQALLGISLLMLILVPAISSFSMRQMQELSITLSLSFTSFALLVLVTILGASSVWRDIEKRYTPFILSVPHGRGVYLVGKFLSIAVSLIVSALLLGLVSSVAIAISSAGYASAAPVQWPLVALAVATDCFKYILLAAIAVLFSSISTSFFLPFFGTISIFLAGSASQEVYDYVSGDFGSKIDIFSRSAIKLVYYVLPNFGSFNFKLYAIYPVPLPFSGLVYTIGYFLVYSALVISLAVWSFSRRELP